MGTWLAWGVLAACDGAEPAAVEAPPAPEPVVTAPGLDQAGAGAAVSNVAARYGTIREVIGSGGYSYVRVEACGAEAWVAAPQTELAVGAAIEMPLGTVMTNFKSPTLDRTFDAILFVDWMRASTLAPDCAAMAAAAAPPPAPGAAPSPSENPWVNGKMASGHGGAGGTPAAGGPAEPSGPPTANEWAGKVVETMNAGGYSYVKLDACGSEMWVAGPQRKLDVGQAVAAGGGVPMDGFHSKTLDRTFDKILFAQTLRVLTELPACR